jgi:hypothetical protein
MIRIIEEIKEAKAKGLGYFHKNYFSDLPGWEEFLKCVFNELNTENPELAKNMNYGSDVDEKAVGNVVVTDSVYFSPQINDLYKHFPNMQNVINEFIDVNGIYPSLAGPKVSIGPRYVAPHQDDWDAFTVQCCGTTIWTITSADGTYKERYFMEPGDLLFFPHETKHELYCEEPRAGLIFNFPMGHIESAP